MRFALRDLRGGLAGLRIFLLCIALGVAAIVGVESLAAALERRSGARGARDPRRRRVVLADSSPPLGRRAAVSRRPRLAVHHRDDARHGQGRERRRGARRAQGGRTVVAADWRGRLRPVDAARRRAVREGRRVRRGGGRGAAGSAEPEARRRRSHRRGKIRDPDRPDERAGSIGDRRRPRPPCPHFAGGARRDRTGPAGIAGSLDDPRRHGRRRRRAGRSRGSGAPGRGQAGLSAGRMGDALAPQRFP